MRVTLIHNPRAGDEQPSSDELLALIRQAGYEVTYQSSKENNWDLALEEPGDFVVVAGGDGTVGKVAKRLIGQQIAIAVLPVGTANNISKTLGLTETPLEQLIAGWAAARRFAFDGAVASGAWGSTYFLESLGSGLFTQTMSEAKDNSAFDPFNAQEKMTAILRMFQDRLQSCAAKKLKVTLDGEDLSGEYLLLEVMNIQYVGPNLALTLDANPGDGLLDVVFVSEGDREQLNEYLSDRLRGKQHPLHLTIHQGKHLQIQGEDFKIHIDDEMLPDKSSTFSFPATIEVNVDPHSLEFLLPARADLKS